MVRWVSGGSGRLWIVVGFGGNEEVPLIGIDEMAYCLCMYCSSCFFSLIY